MQKLLLFFLLLLIFPFDSTAETFKKDVSDLQDMKELVIQSNINLKGWNNDSDPCGNTTSCGINNLPSCKWEGLACWLDKDQNLRIIAISIKGKVDRKLKGNLPPTLPTMLRSILLPNNQLQGNLSDPLCQGKTRGKCQDIWSRNAHLDTIDLANNDLEGNLPNWQRLRKLKVINLSHNDFDGFLPKAWKQCYHLEEIHVSSNSLSGPLPNEWGELAALKNLSLAHNKFTDQIPPSWYRMPKLRVLDVTGNCAICGKVPEQDFNFIINGEDTHLKTECSDCDGCKCRQGTLRVVVTNVLLSFSVLVLSLIAWFMRQWCKRNETQELPTQHPATVPMKTFEPPTIVICPDGQFFLTDTTNKGPSGKNTDLPSGKSSSASSSSPEESSCDESSEWHSGSDSDSVDSKVLAFMHNSSPVIRMSDRTRSADIAVVQPEIIHEGYNSDKGAKISFKTGSHRRSKSALEGITALDLSLPGGEPLAAETNMGPSSSTGQTRPDMSLPENSSNPQRKRFRSFRRKNRKGPAGNFKISEPQRSLGIPEDLNTASLWSHRRPAKCKATQTATDATSINKK